MKTITLTIMSLFTLFQAIGQDITGQWNGILNVQGTQLTLIFHIEKTDSGFNSTMDSPDQGQKGIPVNSTSFDDSTLILKVDNLQIEYTGILNESGEIKGTFKQSGYTFPLNLYREMQEKHEIIRSQDPKEPYPYYTEDVIFENKKAHIKLAGTLSLPDKGGIFPVVVLISGSGPQNRNEELLGHRPFLVLADHLTRNGIAVLRFDDRGTAESEGDFASATSEDFASDAESAVNYLKTRSEIDTNKIGLIGHSEGGIIAPMVASRDKDVNFIVLLAGTGIPGDELLLMQQQLVGKAEGLSDSELKIAGKINKGAFDIIVNSNNNEDLSDTLKTYLKHCLADYPKQEMPSGMTEDEFINLQVKQLTSPWFIYFLSYDPSEALKHVKCPVLALNGEKDLQVPPAENLKAIEETLKSAGNTNVTIKKLKGLNHLFQECNSGAPSEYSEIDQTFSPLALNTISEWIKQQTK